MKRSLFLLIFAIYSLSGFSQNMVENKIAKSFSKYLLGQFDLLARNSKVGILFLKYNDGNVDTISTRLGIVLAKELTKNLSNPDFINEVEYEVKKRAKVRILNYELDIYKQYEPYLQKYYNPYKQKLLSLWGKYAPDYYLQIKYKLDTDSVGNCVVNFYSIKLKPGYVLEPIKKTVDIPGYKYTVKTQNDCKRLKELNVRVKPVNPAYKKLLSASGNGGNNATGDILRFYDIRGQEVETLYIGEQYFIALTLEEPEYVYIFYYDPYAKQEYSMYVIHPYKEDYNLPYSAGTYRFPVGGTFSFSPPPSQLYFKVFLTNQKIPLKINTQKNTQGYVPVITPAQTEKFYANLQKISSKKFTKILYLERK